MSLKTVSENEKKGRGEGIKDETLAEEDVERKQTVSLFAYQFCMKQENIRKKFMPCNLTLRYLPSPTTPSSSCLLSTPDFDIDSHFSDKANALKVRNARRVKHRLLRIK